jgi:hypothetical protein
VLDPAGGLLHGVGRETAAVNAAVDFAAEETGGFQDAKVLGDGRERDIKGGGQFSDRGFASGQAR